MQLRSTAALLALAMALAVGGAGSALAQNETFDKCESNTLKIAGQTVKKIEKCEAKEVKTGSSAQACVDNSQQKAFKKLAKQQKKCPSGEDVELAADSLTRASELVRQLATSVYETLEPCDQTVYDTWDVAVGDGEAFLAEVDTLADATWFDTDMDVDCDLQGPFGGDDGKHCLFNPTENARYCSTVAFTSSADQTCTIYVFPHSSESCEDPDLGEYRLRVTLDGAVAPVVLTGDDIQTQN